MPAYPLRQLKTYHFLIKTIALNQTTWEQFLEQCFEGLELQKSDKITKNMAFLKKGFCTVLEEPELI